MDRVRSEPLTTRKECSVLRLKVGLSFAVSVLVCVTTPGATLYHFVMAYCVISTGMGAARAIDRMVDRRIARSDARVMGNNRWLMQSFAILRRHDVPARPYGGDRG